VSSLGSGAFALLLALTDGADGVLHGAVHPSEYLANLTTAPPAGEFVRTFVERIDEYSVHVRGHPPGFVLVLKALDSGGLGDGWPTALLSVAATMALTAGVLVTVWVTVDADWMRRVAPLLVVRPYVLWAVTSGDAVFAAVGAWGVAACAFGLRTSGWRAVVAGAVGGLLLASLLFLAYGGATFLLPPVDDGGVRTAVRCARQGTNRRRRDRRGRSGHGCLRRCGVLVVRRRGRDPPASAVPSGPDAADDPRPR